jgi:hypothetical protein
LIVMSAHPRLPTASGRNVVSDELRALRKLADERRSASFAAFRRIVRQTGSPKGKGPRRDRKPIAA